MFYKKKEQKIEMVRVCCCSGQAADFQSRDFERETERDLDFRAGDLEPDLDREWLRDLDLDADLK